MKHLLVLVCLTFSLAPRAMHAQWGTNGEAEANPRADLFRPRFRAAFDVLQFRSADGRVAARSEDSTRIDLYLAVPYRSLQFLYNGNSYVAEYSATIKITHGDTVVRDLFTSYSVLEPAAEHHTNGVEHADAEQLSFHLPPGIGYRIELSLQDSYSKRDFDTSFTLTVKQFRSDAPAMSDLLLYRDRTGMNIVPSIGPDVSSLEDERRDKQTSANRSELGGGSKGIFAELYDMPPNAALGIVTIAEAADSGSRPGTIVFRAATVVTTGDANGPARTFTSPAAGANVLNTPVFVPLDLRNLWLGQYTLRMYVLPAANDTTISDPSQLAQRAITSTSRTIRVGIAPGIPLSLDDLDQAIEQLHVIATSAEWDSLSQAKTQSEKRDAILNFWSHKRFSGGSQESGIGTRSNEAMEVFYSRVEYADEHFSSGFGEGWRSDRGHLYIALGPPDNIEDNPQSYSQTFGGMQRAYQLWQYTRLGSSYVLVDDYGLGDYRLRGAFPPEGTFDR